VVAEPSNGLCLIADVRNFLGVPTTDTDQDENIAAYIEAACDHIERHLGRTLMYQSTPYTEYFEIMNPTSIIYLKQSPIIAITSVDDGWDVYSASGTTLTADQDYFVSSSERAKLVRIGAKWSTGRRSVRVVYSGGYAAQSNVPEALKQCAVEVTAILWHQGKLGDGRLGLSGKSGGGGGVSGFSEGIPASLMARINQFRRARGLLG